MAQSASAMAKKAPARRPILKDGAGFEYINTYKKGQKQPIPLHKFKFEQSKNNAAWQKKWNINGTWAQARKIKNRGLAKRSWLWGLRKLGGAEGGKGAIPGTSRVYSIVDKNQFDFVKEDRLHYIWEAMPKGWQAEVRMRAGNKIMAQAANKIERDWTRTMGNSGALGARRTFESFAKRAA